MHRIKIKTFDRCYNDTEGFTHFDVGPNQSPFQAALNAAYSVLSPEDFNPEEDLYVLRKNGHVVTTWHDCTNGEEFELCAYKLRCTFGPPA